MQITTFLHIGYILMVHSIYMLCEYRYHILHIHEGIPTVDVCEHDIHKHLLYWNMISSWCLEVLMCSCCAFKLYTINEKWHIIGNNSTAIKLKKIWHCVLKVAISLSQPENLLSVWSHPYIFIWLNSKLFFCNPKHMELFSVRQISLHILFTLRDSLKKLYNISWECRW